MVEKTYSLFGMPIDIQWTDKEYERLKVVKLAKKGKVQRKRTAFTTQSGRPPKITKDQRTLIRSLYKDGGITQPELARMYKVSQVTIHRIVSEAAA
jgi:DNA invertase Pin-like site-specific DNA recombinase